jgi:hypothetical protein
LASVPLIRNRIASTSAQFLAPISRAVVRDCISANTRWSTTGARRDCASRRDCNSSSSGSVIAPKFRAASFSHTASYSAKTASTVSRSDAVFASMFEFYRYALATRPVIHNPEFIHRPTSTTEFIDYQALTTSCPEGGHPSVERVIRCAGPRSEPSKPWASLMASIRRPHVCTTARRGDCGQRVVVLMKNYNDGPHAQRHALCQCTD